jgi:hypothetical protein
MKIYDNFKEYIELFVKPRKSENPDHFRLDGWKSGSNLEIAGVFRHQNKVWKVHGDTRYEPLLLAYDVMTKRLEDPFIEQITITGKGNTLTLKNDVQQLLSKPRFKYLYIYRYNQK